MFTIEKNKVPIYSWCNSPESSAIDQASNLANHPAVFSHVALMPDTHAGVGMPIGGVVALQGAICPNMVGVDIACGMMACKTNIKRDKITDDMLKNVIVQVRRDLPMGHNHQKTDRWKDISIAMMHKYTSDCTMFGVLPDEEVRYEAIYGQLGTLGGGNHFIEIQYDEEENVWFMIHSGSRNIGKRICDKYDKLARAYCEGKSIALPSRDLSFLHDNTIEGLSYIVNMNFCVQFSFQNRDCMAVDVLYAMKRCIESSVEMVEKINIHHNYAAVEDHFGRKLWIHRKGATLASKGNIGVIPGSMGTSSYIVKGLGNPQSFNSCSHGSGRNMSRGDAKRRFNIDQFKESMKGVVSLDIDMEHLDESPMSYKNIDVVMEEQKDLVDIVHILSPMANMKG